MLNPNKVKYIIAVFIYGTIGVFLRYVSFPSELIVFLRGLFGSLMVLAFIYLKGDKLDKEGIKNNFLMLILSGACLGFNWICLFKAYTITTVAIASLCNYLAPIIVIFISPLVFKTKIVKKKIACIILSLVGVVFVSGVIESGFNGVNYLGIIFGMLAALGFVGLIIFNKKINNIKILSRVVIQLFVSSLVVLPYLILNNLHTTIEFDWLSVIITVILCIVHTGFAYCLYYGSMPLISVNSIAILGYIEPVISILSSVIILKENLSVFGIVGSILIIGSAVVSEIIQTQ